MAAVSKTIRQVMIEVSRAELDLLIGTAAKQAGFIPVNFTIANIAVQESPSTPGTFMMLLTDDTTVL